MKVNAKMTVVDLLCDLRERLLKARSEKDQQTLLDIQTTLELLADTAAKHGDVPIASILEEMVCSTRDSLMGVEWKSHIASIEEIRSAALSRQE